MHARLNIIKKAPKDYKLMIGESGYEFASLNTNKYAEEWFLFIGIAYSTEGQIVHEVFYSFEDALIFANAKYNEWLKLAGLQPIYKMRKNNEQ